MKVVNQDGTVEQVAFAEELGKTAFRHTSAHILAQAVKRLYPNTKCAIGPAIEDGFYYDFDFDFSFTEDKLPVIEAEMKKIVKEALSIKRFVLSREEAVALMTEKQEPYKLQLIEELPEGEELTFFQQGDYVELCAGPHVANTSVIKAIKLTKVSGAYFRGDEKNLSLIHISEPTRPY